MKVPKVPLPYLRLKKMKIDTIFKDKPKKIDPIQGEKKRCMATQRTANHTKIFANT